MKARNITITIDKAREWFHSGDEALKKVALQVFSKDELVCDFRSITTFKKACEVLGFDYTTTVSAVENIAYYSKSSAAMFKLNIIREALNLGCGLSLTEDPRGSYIYYPLNPFAFNSSSYYEGELNSGKMEVIGKIKSEGEVYNVLGGSATSGSDGGLGSFCFGDGVGFAYANFGFLGCATKEIAKHFGKYFGMLITEAKYADVIEDFEIIESKYSI